VRSCRIRSLRQGGGLRTSGSKSLRQGEVLPMSGKTAPRPHVQHTLNARRAASVITVSRTASQVRVVRCPCPCDLPHQPLTVQVQDRNQEDRRSTVDCLLRRGGCTATCNSQLFFVRVDYPRTSSFMHIWIVLGISGVCACTACTHSDLGICGGARRRREYGLKQFIGTLPSQTCNFTPYCIQRFINRTSYCRHIAYRRQTRLDSYWRAIHFGTLYDLFRKSFTPIVVNTCHGDT
jgi:hypothetical protein